MFKYYLYNLIFFTQSPNMQLSPSNDVSLQPKPTIQGQARIFAIVKGRFLVHVRDLPAVIRIGCSSAPIFARSTSNLKPLMCEVTLFRWCAKDNVFYGNGEPLRSED